jgi:hypothetical protein
MKIKRTLLILLAMPAISFANDMKQFDIYYHLSKGNSSRQVIRITADNHFNAQRIFESMLPGCRFSEYREVK